MLIFVKISWSAYSKNLLKSILIKITHKIIYNVVNLFDYSGVFESIK